MNDITKLKFDKVEHDPFADGELVDAFPATAPQREIWMGAWIGGVDANRAFNECLILRLEGPLRLDVLMGACRRLVERHDALRTTFSVDGEWCLVGAHGNPTIAVHDWATLSPAARRERFDVLRDAEVTTPFELACGPLHRATVVRWENDVHLFFFSAHHIVCDWWSAGVLMADLAELYSAASMDASNGDSSPAQFSRYARAENDRARGVAGEVDLAYWLNNLGDYQSNWALPSSRRDPRHRTYASRRLDVEWGESASDAVRRLGKSHQCTMTVTLLSVLQIWLHLKTGASDIVIGVPSAGQMSHEDSWLVGHCVHLLPFRLRCAAEATYGTLLAAAKTQVLRGLEHRQITYSSLLGYLPSARRAGMPPLVAVCLNVDKGLPPLPFTGLKVSYETIARRFEIFDLSLNVIVRESRLVLQFNYNTQLFDAAAVRGWALELERVARLGVLAPEVPLSSLASTFETTTGEPFGIAQS